MNRARSIVPNRLLDHREAAALDAREEQGRPAGRTDAAMDLGHFEPGIDFGVDAHQLAVPLEIVDAFAKCAVAHLMTCHRVHREHRGKNSTG